MSRYTAQKKTGSSRSVSALPSGLRDSISLDRKQTPIPAA